MLSHIITKINERVLSTLLDRDASLSEIARMTNTTKANVFRSLKALEKEDLARKEIQGRTHLYHFNYLHPQAKEIWRLLLEEKKKEYYRRMSSLPVLLNSLLKNMLKEKYFGCIFFGSSLTGSFKDIDVFIIASGTKKEVLFKELKKLNPKISPIIGTKEELINGFTNEDMLYKNILKGLPYYCEDFVLELKQRSVFLRKKDIHERFIIGYREILSCLEFPEKEYVKKHLERGVMDVAYAALNYFDLFPENDYSAKKMFKKQFCFWFSGKVEEAKKQAEKLGELIL